MSRRARALHDIVDHSNGNKTYWCPRCREKTLIPCKIQGIEGEYTILRCINCGYVLDYEATMSLRHTSTCITPDMVIKVQQVLQHSRDVCSRTILSYFRTYMRNGKLYFVKRFDIETGQEALCLEYDPFYVPDDKRKKKEVPTPREVYVAIMSILSTILHVKEL